MFAGPSYALDTALNVSTVTLLRDWSLITGRGGYKMGGGGMRSFTPKKVLAMLKRGAQQVLG